MDSVAYIGRNNNIHDRRIIQVLSKNFHVLEMYTKDLGSKPLSIDFFAGVSLIVAGPLTDAISAIPISVKVPILGISHAFDLNSEAGDLALSGNVARCAAIISDCGYITKILRGTYNFQRDIIEMPWGCDRGYFSSAKINFEKKIKILVTRNWFSVYRNDVILEALKLLNSKNIEFSCTFIGDGPLLEDQKRNLNKMSQSLDVRFLGYKSSPEIRSAMSDNWIYLSAASSDGSSISLLEAMAAGMICVTTDFPSNKEWIEHSVSGFLFRNGDSEALALQIELISSLSIKEKKEMSRNAKEIILKRGDWKLNQNALTSIAVSMI